MKKILFTNERIIQAEITLKEGETTRRHYHQRTVETYQVQKGQGVIHIGNTHVVARSKCFVVIPAGVAHWIKNTGRYPLAIISTKDRNEHDDVQYFPDEE